MTGLVDVHVHPPVAGFLDGPLAPYLEALRSHLGAAVAEETAGDLADRYRRLGGRAVLLGWDTESRTGLRPFSSSDVAGLVATAPDVFVGFGAVDPLKGSGAVADVHQTARLGLRGLSVHPAAQGVTPSDRATFPVWETAEEHGLVCQIHTGFTRLGAGLPGGGGVHLEPARPLHVDAVAAAFPGLTIVLSHAGPLWLEEALAVAVHKANVWMDLSGLDPRSLPGTVVEVLVGTLQDRVMFGSDYPFASPESWLEAWDALGLPAEVTRKVVGDNAVRLLGLEPT